MSEQNINVIPAQDLNDRFDRVERKLDKLSDAMISLARTEEKIASIESDRNTTVERLNRHSSRIDDLNLELSAVKQIAKDNNKVTENIRKLIWIVITIGTTSIAGYFFT